MGDDVEVKGVNLRTFLTLLTGFAFLLSAVDLISYWLPFNINIFVHLSPSDILSRSIVPVAIAVALSSFVLFPHMNPSRHDSLAEKLHSNKSNKFRIANFMLRLSPVIALLIGLMFQFVLKYNLYPLFYFSAIILFSIRPLLRSEQSSVIERYIGVSLHSVILAITILAAMSTYSLKKSLDVKDGTRYLRAEVHFKSKEDIVHKKYIGETSDTIFLYSFDYPEVIEIRKSEIKMVKKTPSNCARCAFDDENAGDSLLDPEGA